MHPLVVADRLVSIVAPYDQTMTVFPQAAGVAVYVKKNSEYQLVVPNDLDWCRFGYILTTGPPVQYVVPYDS